LVASWQVSFVQTSVSAQSIGVPPPHTPFWHVSPVTQNSEPSHEAPLATGTHCPDPLQVLHVPHGSPGLAATHAPMPLQVPPHEPAVEHSASGSVPAGTGVHVPTTPATTHDWHTPEQVVLQHTPSAQLPLWHWSAPAHIAPCGFFV